MVTKNVSPDVHPVTENMPFDAVAALNVFLEKYGPAELADMIDG